MNEDQRKLFEAALLATLKPSVTVSLKRDKHGDYVAPFAAGAFKLWKLAHANAARDGDPRQCCAEYATCLRPCTPRGEIQIQRGAYIWLGRWRDKLPPEAVTALQDILGALR